MRVFYPISTRLSEILNDETRVPSGWLMLWSIPCFALSALVLSALPSFEVGTTNEYSFFSTHQFNHASVVTHAKKDGNMLRRVGQSGQPVNANTKLRLSTQEYIDAHRYAQYFTTTKPLLSQLPPAAPIQSKANDGLYL